MRRLGLSAGAWAMSNICGSGGDAALQNKGFSSQIANESLINFTGDRNLGAEKCAHIPRMCIHKGAQVTEVLGCLSENNFNYCLYTHLLHFR